jgi:hypothetical protein
MASQRSFFGFGLLAVAVSAVFLAVRFGMPAPAETPGKVPTDPIKPPPDKIGETPVGPILPPPLLNNVFIGRSDPKRPRKIHTVLTTRKGDTTYQGLIRYEPQLVPVEELPGYAELAQLTQLPSKIVRIDQETEMLIDNLGEPMRSITSSHLYLDPVNPHVIAYDIANTSGGAPQRFIGHLTRKGVSIDVYRGGEAVDRHEMPFSTRDTFIPVEFEFIHQWYLGNPEARAAKRPVTFSVFIPEVMSFLFLNCKPLADEVIPVKNSTFDCAHYDVTTISTQSIEPLTGRQQMWFDKRSGLMMKREDFEASLAVGDAPVTERGEFEHLGKLKELTVRPPVFPAQSERPFPYALDQDLVYSVKVRSGDGDLGRLRFRFTQFPPGPANEKEPFAAAASVSLDATGASRHETAATRFSKSWLPRTYEASGDEYGDGDAKAKYRVAAALDKGEIGISLFREVEPSAPPVVSPSDSDPKTQTPPKAASEDDWKDPLVRVPIDEEDVKAAAAARSKTLITTQSLSRKLSTGTYLYDFNRIEHLAALAFRLPLPPIPKDGEEPQTIYQKAALYSVRQNRCGVIMFEIKPEPRPVLTERQKSRLAAKDRNEPQLFVANAASPMLPCRMLLTAEGRLLELTLKLGNNDVVYTLDDPIMRRRAERAKKQKLQEGPQIIRPPWW